MILPVVTLNDRIHLVLLYILSLAGIEDVDDLLRDLQQAFDSFPNTVTDDNVVLQDTK